MRVSVRAGAAVVAAGVLMAAMVVPAMAAGASSLSFTQVVSDPLNYPPTGVAADVNGDGITDVVNFAPPPGALQSAGGAVVNAYLGSLSGAWTKMTSPFVGSPASVRGSPLLFSDVNGDGNIDLISAVCSSADRFGNCSSTSPSALSWSWSAGNGDGTFGSRTPFGSSGPNPTAYIGDVTGDGIDDVVMADGSSSTPSFTDRVRVLPGNGSGFDSPIMVTTMSATQASARLMSVADINGDTIDDIVLLWQSKTDMQFHRQTYLGGPSLTLAEDVSSDGLPGTNRSQAAGDLNGDGFADLLVHTDNQQTGPDGGTVEIISAYTEFSNGDGSFAAPTLADSATISWIAGPDGTTLISTPYSYTLVPIALADVDGDGVLDLVSSEGFNRGRGDGTFEPPEQLRYRLDNPGLIRDFDGDGRPDFIGVDLNLDQMVLVLVHPIVEGDVDGDGIADGLDAQWADHGVKVLGQRYVSSTEFTDGSTFGSVADTGGLAVSVQDSPDPGKGVVVTAGAGTGQAQIDACGLGSVFVDAGSSVVLTCGSIKVEVLTGSAHVVVGDGAIVVDVSAGVTARVADAGDGHFTVQNLGGGSVTVTKNGSSSVVAAGATRTVSVAGDDTPPGITPTVTGTLGDNGWYRSDVTVSWTVTDPDSAISATTACETSTLTTDTAGVSFTCAATSDGGTASQTVTVKRDATAPAVSFAAHPASYTIDQTVAIVCTASDALSGIATSSCPSVNGPAYTFPVGVSTLSATAADVAGNTETASTGFSVAVTPPSLCNLTGQFEYGSAKYQALTASQRKLADALTNVACRTFNGFVAKASPAQNAAIIKAYSAFVGRLANQGWLTASQATVLTTAAMAL